MYYLNGIKLYTILHIKSSHPNECEQTLVFSNIVYINIRIGIVYFSTVDLSSSL